MPVRAVFHCQEWLPQNQEYQYWVFSFQVNILMADSHGLNCSNVKGIPVATLIEEAGATNAALFAISIFAQEDNALLVLKNFRIDQEES